MGKKLAAAATAILLLISGCSNNEVSNKPSEKTKEPPKVEKQTETVLPNQFPLTGIRSKESTDGRAVAVMINNLPQARPQSGLNKADIIYEILAEGNVTRFLAVFQSEKPEKVGPVRSARSYYIELAKGLGSLYIAHGYSPEAKRMLQSGYIDNLNGMVYDGTLFKRASFRKPPHNSYITYQNILKGASLNHYQMEKTPPAFTFMTEKESSAITGKDVPSALVTYYGSRIFNDLFVYDPSLGRYKRFSAGAQTIDLETKAPILLDNIFIVEMKHAIVDKSGRREIDMKSGGKGYLLQKGKMQEVEWKNNEGRIVPYRNDSVVPFVPGKTWVNIIPTEPGLLKSVKLNAQ